MDIAVGHHSDFCELLLQISAVSRTDPQPKRNERESARHFDSQRTMGVCRHSNPTGTTSAILEEIAADR